MYEKDQSLAISILLPRFAKFTGQKVFRIVIFLFRATVLVIVVSEFIFLNTS